ncbi:MAG TPA: S9 family peptidase [Steroidobacteraceae bacterium]|nr:S9 family peptidase [Steroidobacteraceae bacterium]
MRFARWATPGAWRTWNRRSARLLSLQFIILTCMCSTAAAEKLTIERLFAAPDLSGASLRSPHISPDSHYVAYLRAKESNKDRLDLWAYDIARRQHRLLVDSALLEPRQRALSAEEEQRRERQRTSSLSGIVEYEFSPDSRYLLVPLGGDLYVYDLQAQPEKAVRHLTSGGKFETDAHFSPRGSYVSFIRDQNLIVYDLATSTERPITRDGRDLVSYGTAEFIAQEEMDRSTGYWWSPDEKHIAYTRVDEAPVPEVDRFEIYADGVKVVKQRYPAAGTANASVQLFVATLGQASTLPPVRIDLGTNPDIYLARVNWLPGGAKLAVQRESRDQKTLTLLEADADTGITRELLSEHSDKWINLHDELTFLEHSRRFIWASSRSGFKHLYLYDLDGKLLEPLTSGEWEVVGDGAGRAIRGIDEKRGLIYFMSNAESPLERHLYSVSFESAHPVPTRITTDVGWHDVTMSKGAKIFLDTFSTPDRPPSVTLRAADGKSLEVLVPNELTPDHPYAPYLSEHASPEFGTLKASDGQTLYYELTKPRDLVPDKRYPVVVDVYGGPGVQRVRRAWGGISDLFRQYLVQQGYIVFTLDNRGSTARGVRFETAIYHQMSKAEVQDQVTGVSYLKTLPFVDPKRIAVFGWSYGGYMALMCMMQAPDVFAAGISGAPVTDWRLYDTHYTERYMGTPQENAAGYTESSVMTYAGQLRGPLLIMHGMADDNVLFTHSTTLFKKLQDLDKPFDIMVYPGSKHGLLRHADTGVHGYATIKRFLDTQLGTR